MPTASVKELLKRAKSALDDKDFPSALKVCREILKTDKQNYHAFVFVGVATAAQGDLTRAVQSYQRAIKLRPNLQLAYKGLIEALSESTQAEHQLISARAHFQLGRVSPQHAEKSLPTAASMLYSLSTEDPALTSEAVEALRESQRCNTSLSHEQNAEITYRIARLLVRSHQICLTDDAEDLLRALEMSPLSEALDEYENLLTCSPRSPLEIDVSQCVVKRAMLRCLLGDQFEPNLEILLKAGAYETVLEVAELDKATAVSAAERALLAMRHVHLCPFRKNPTRSNYILAAELFSKTRRLDVASRISRVDTAVTTKQAGHAAKFRVSSCTQAIVNAFFHVARGEYKLASLVASEGKTIAATTDRRRRCEACFNLLNAAALCGDRKYKESLKYYNAARLYGQCEGHSWVENASHQGIVKTSVLAYGRRSRQASTAVEEAAGCSSSMFGVLECTWSDALAGDIDAVRMEELVEEATKRARLHVTPDYLEWECSILDSTFVKSTQEIAATSKTRLGQTIVRDTGASTAGLGTAKRHQMEAATIFKGLPDPFAQLGYILEQLSGRNSDDKMLSRAVRCYEKAIAFDPAHPVASRRLTQLLLRRGQRRDAAHVAMYASEKDPKARWAHNVIGWVRLLDGRPIEAAVSFRNALRGRPRLSSKEEEAIFGTDIGQTEDDNLLVIDVDSWRGLSAAYRKMGKLGPAVACLDDALALAQYPPKVYVISTSADISEVRKGLRLILDAEKALMLISQRNTPMTAFAMDSLRSSIISLPLIQYSLSDAFIELAAEQWMRGCYCRATRLRQTAVQLMEYSVQGLTERHPGQNGTCVLKRLGDVLMEVVTCNPAALTYLVGKNVVVRALEKAITTYARALHLSPWRSNEGVQDFVASICRTAYAKQDGELASCAVYIAAANKLDPMLTSISLLEAGAITSHGKLAHPANSIARRMSVSPHPSSAIIELSAAMSCHACEGDIGLVVDSAVMAIRRNPLDWRGWYAVGRVRELDAKERNWPHEVTKSCEEAFSEADRLGGGPAAVAGRVRCAMSLVRDFSKETTEDISKAYSQACLGASNAARMGIGEPSACSDVINRHRQNVESEARDLFRTVSLENTFDLLRNLHVFPFLDEAVTAFRPLVAQMA